MVTVTEVDVPRKRVGLSMKTDPFAQQAPTTNTPVHKKSKPKNKPKPKEKDLSMEEKLALLVNKFKK
jgi:uncharacterized protein